MNIYRKIDGLDHEAVVIVGNRAAEWWFSPEKRRAKKLRGPVSPGCPFAKVDEAWRLHNVDGPAVIVAGQEPEFWLHGKRCSRLGHRIRAFFLKWPEVAR